MEQEKSNGKQCEYKGFKRTNFFPWMLVTEKEFQVEQAYLNGKRKLLNQMLHGWGVVCGLIMRSSSEEGKKDIITITRGLAFDYCGNEIYVDKDYDFHIPKASSTSLPSAKKSTPEQKCQDKETGQRQEADKEPKWYVTIRYTERQTDLVPGYSPGGGCEKEENGCKPSRITEGYCIELINSPKDCPKILESEKVPCEKLKGKNEEIRKFLCEDLLLSCPDACCGESKDQPPVILGSVTLDNELKIKMINNWDCRRYVVTFRLLEHWMRQFAPMKIPFELIADYPRFASACKSEASAVSTFNAMCGEKPATQPQEDVRIIEGEVLDTNKRGIAGLTVMANDKDVFKDDILGKATTDAKGKFTIRYTKESYKAHFEGDPDIYLKVYEGNVVEGNEPCFDTKKAVRCEAKAYEYFKIILGSDKWFVEGCVKDNAGKGIDGLVVTLYDKDVGSDDSLGKEKIKTKSGGKFSCEFTKEEFKGCFEGESPEVYVQVYDSTGSNLLHESKVRKGCKQGLVEYFEVRIPRP